MTKEGNQNEMEMKILNEVEIFCQMCFRVPHMCNFVLLRNHFNGFKGIHYSNAGLEMNFETYLSDENLKKCVKKFSSLKLISSSKELAGKASVLIPLCHVYDDLCLLYTKRTNSIKRHRGQISFPGGMCDGDETPEQTALRETEEEIGIPRGKVKMYGCGASIVRSGVLITPIVGYIGRIGKHDIKINKKEVQYAFTIPLSILCDPNCCKHTRFRNSYTLPVFIIDDFRIWGITGFLTHIFLKCLLGDVYELEEFQLMESTKILQDH